jgi:hypothetical protein
LNKSATKSIFHRGLSVSQMMHQLRDQSPGRE